MDRAVSVPRTGGLIEDVGLLLLLVFLVPIAILVVGTPIALAVRLVVELAHRL